MVVLAIFLFPVIAFSQQEQPKPWEVPDEYRNMENPVK